MKIISAAALQQLRGLSNASLTDTCTIQRRMLVADGKGGKTATYSDFATDVPCRVAPVSVQRSASETVVGAKPASLFDVLIRLSYAQDVVETDRIAWNSRTFEVKKPRPRTELTILVVEANEVK